MSRRFCCESTIITICSVWGQVQSSLTRQGNAVMGAQLPRYWDDTFLAHCMFPRSHMTSSPFSPMSTDHVAGAALHEGLQPVLRNALTSLNVNLEYELARYRQARQGQLPLRATPPQFQPKRRSLNLMPVPSPRVSPSEVLNTSSNDTTAVTPPPPPPNPRLQSQDVAVPQAASTSEVSALRSALVYAGAAPDETGYLASSAALLEAESSAHSFPSPPEPDFTQAPRRGGESFLTPLGLGGFLLLLVGSASFGFALVNPAVVQNLTKNTPLSKLWPLASESGEREESEATKGAIASNSETSGHPAGQTSPLNPLSPDLSQKEFTRLDLKTLSTVPSGVSPKTPTPNSGRQTPLAPTAPRTPPSAPSRLSATSSVPTVTGIPSTTVAPPQAAFPAPAPSYEPSPAPTYEPDPAPTYEPSPPATIPSNGDNGEADSAGADTYAESPTTRQAPASNYYVVTDYTGDPSLEAARNAVEDAYVRNFDIGARIQLGAFNTPEGAAALMEALESQGIEAQIYEPGQ